MYRLALLLFLLFIAPALPAQSHYDGQIRAIEQMLANGRYELAYAQSEALVEEGKQQQLTNIEAYGNYLLGRSLLEDPATEGRDRIRGVRLLRRASRGFSDMGLTETVDSIATRLRNLAKVDTTDIEQLPGIGELRRQNNLTTVLGAEELDNSTLGAIVALQNEEIEALTDSQLRQLIELQQKDIAIDSFELELLNDSLLLMRQEVELETQQALTQQERLRRNFLVVVVLGVVVALALLYLRYRTSRRYQSLLQQKNELIKKEQQRSDDLLLNILPATVARELKRTGKATARRYESASVLFTDFVGFSTIASGKEPEELVQLLDRTFRAFDEITERHGLEKIKTIGDAYMCVGGVPTEDLNHARKAVAAALEIQEYLAAEGVFRARIGIHSGPVVAGVVGQRKFAYDIWGDTVNQAARLEAAGQVGEVTVSEATCALLGEAFACEHVGVFEAKNIGVMDRYVVRTSRLTKNPS